MQGSTVRSAELCVHSMSTTQYSSQVPPVTDEEIKGQSIEGNFSSPSYKEKSLFIRDEVPYRCVGHRPLNYSLCQCPMHYIIIVENTLDFSSSSILLSEGPELGQYWSDQDYLRSLRRVRNLNQEIKMIEIEPFLHE